LLLLKVNPTKFDPVSVNAPEDLLGYPSWAAPVLSHGLLYVRDEKRLVCFELIPPRK
jgi:hypothetical protein